MAASANIGTAHNPFVILDEPSNSRASRGLEGPAGLIPSIPLEDGQQYRFHFNMASCIGCKCCEVACSEQNNNPADVSWRRVGEVEGGHYPNTQRLYMSMGCNHCVEPSCMTGCPTEAYEKSETTGVVIHDPNVCIGCEYCIWNCPYGVPVFNEERGVVGKCDMCHNRLDQGRAPSCVDACPESAIRIEIVDIEDWKNKYAEEANAPGLPSADTTISTTRVTLPDDMPPAVEKADYHRVRPEKPHWALVFMTVMTQLSVGGFSAAWLLSLLADSFRLNLAASAALAVGLMSFGASPLHLGRPIFAYRAMKGWRRSWLSREIVLLTSFGGVASLYAVLLWTGAPGAAPLGGLGVLLGVCGLGASAAIYLVPARPAWNSPHTVAEFLLSAAILGPLFLTAIGVDNAALPIAAAVAAAAQLFNRTVKVFGMIASDEFELQASARLLSNDFRKLFMLRLSLLLLGGVAAPLAGYPLVALPVAAVGELIGRYLFFVSVVPKNMAMGFFGQSWEDAA